MKKTTTITSKGQVTIPKDVREEMHLHPGDRVTFRIEEGGAVRLVPVARPVTDLRGLLKAPEGPPATVEEMDQSIIEEVSRQDELSRGR